MNKKQTPRECIRCEGSGTHKYLLFNYRDHGRVEWDEMTCKKCEGSGVSDEELLWDEIDWDTAEFDGINRRDAPDYCDAFITAVDFKDGGALTDKQLDSLDDQTVSEALWDRDDAKIAAVIAELERRIVNGAVFL